MNLKSREIKIDFIKKDKQTSFIPVSVFYNTIRILQQTIYELGKIKLEKQPSLPGRPPSVLRRELELFFVKAEPGSLSTTLKFPEKEASLFPEFPDFAEQVSEDMHKLINGIKNNDYKIIHNCIPIPAYRKKILSNLFPIIPKKQDDYEISFTFGELPSIQNIERPPDDQIEKFIGYAEEIKAEKPKEAIIQARCLAEIRNDGEIEKIVSVIEYELFEEMDLRPFRTAEIEWQGRKFILSHEIACDVRKEDSLIIIEYEPLNIRVFSFSRDEAIESFNEEFALIWDIYAKEDDDNLTEDAKLLKRHLLTLVKEIKKI